MKKKIGKKKIEAAVAIFAVVLALFIVGSVPVMVAEPGDPGEPFPGAVLVTLNAIDNGTGVDYTMYSIDDPNIENFILYIDPFVVDPEVYGYGHHTVFFYSVDRAGNVERVRSVEFDITDTEPPHTTAILEDISGTL